MSEYVESTSRQRSGFLIAVFALLVVRGILYSLVIPPWQAPDEPGHVEYAVLLAQKRGLPSREESSPQLQQQILLSMKEFNFWRYLGREEPQTTPQSFSQDSSLVLSGTQLGDESPLYYLIPALVLLLSGIRDTLLQLYLLRWFSVLLTSDTVVVSYLFASELFPDDRFMRTAVPVVVIFLPMLAYMGSAANSDALAVLLCSLLFWQLVVLFKNGANVRSVSAVVSLTCLAVAAKKTAWFALPLLLAALPIYLWGRHGGFAKQIRRAAPLSVILTIVLMGVSLGWASGDAAAWVKQPPSPTSTRSDLMPRSGSYALRATDDGSGPCQRLVQSLPYNSVRQLRGKTLELSAWVRSSTANQRGRLAIADNEGRDTQLFTGTDTWTLQRVTHTVSDQATSLRIVLNPSGCRDTKTGELYFDDVFLGESREGASNLAANPSAEVPALRVWSRLERIAPQLSLAGIFDARSYDANSLQRYALYGVLTFAGFWANFGWLTLPLDPPWYGALALVCLATLAGLGLWYRDEFTLWSKGGSSLPTWQSKSLLLLVVGLSLILLQTFLPMMGRHWQPQGRYLFPAIIPIATLLSLGWRRIHRRWGSGLGLTAWMAFFFLLHVLCLFHYIIPHYYG
jgi:hypothetical protein